MFHSTKKSNPSKPMNYFKLKTLSFAFAGTVAVASLIGCEEVTEKDLADARENVATERQETAEVRAEGQEDVVAAEQRLEEARHEALRVPYEGGKDDNVLEKEQELNEAKQNLNNKVENENQETIEAEKQAEEVEAKLAATKDRDAYLVTPKSKLEEIDRKLEMLSDEKDGLDEELAQQKIQTEIELLEVKRDALSEAISEVEGIGVLLWQTKKPLVESALKNLDSNNVPSDGLDLEDLESDELGTDNE